MTTTRRLSRVAVVAAVAAVAVTGAALNLWLLEPHVAPSGPVVVTAPPPTTDVTTNTTGSQETMVDPGRPFVVGDAGTVWIALRNGQVVVDSIEASEGWTYQVEDELDGVEVRFRRGDEEHGLEAEVRDGQLRVEVEAEDEPDD